MYTAAAKWQTRVPVLFLHITKEWRMPELRVPYVNNPLLIILAKGVGHLA